MKYDIEIKPKAFKDLKGIPLSDAETILDKIDDMKTGLGSQVKKLTNHVPEYRLRVGDYRVLFELEEGKISVYRILHRKKAYKGN